MAVVRTFAQTNNKAMSFKPSQYQQAVYDFISNGSGNAVIAAVAGSGKSTTIINAMTMIPRGRTSHFFAFNSSIAKELKHKLPNNGFVTSSTIHSYGLKAVMRKYEVKDMSSFIDDSKYSKIFDQTYFITPDAVESISEVKARVMPMVDLARVNLAYMQDDVYALSNKYDVAVSMEDCRLVVDIIAKGMREMKTIDFTDMIFAPVYHDIRTQQYDFIFIDECQDLSECQRVLVMKAVKNGSGRFIAVGDRQQAIYGFTGADAESFDKLTAMPNVTQLPLSVCYRCGSDIIAMAKSIVPQIEAFSGASTGSVEMVSRVADVKAGDMILCRNTYPLVKLGFQYISEGIKAVIVGKDLGANLINMIRKTKAKSFDEMYGKLAKEGDKMITTISRIKGITDTEARNSSQYEAYKDKVEAITVISDGCSDIDEVIQKIETMFGDDSVDAIKLSTIHKAKGLEADNVYIIHAELMPSKNAKLAWQKLQEQNLIYVAYTRAKNKLGFISDFDAYSGKSAVTRAVKQTAQPVVEAVKEVVAVKEGDEIKGEFTIESVVSMTTKFGETKRYTLLRADGLRVTKIGSMSVAVMVSGNQLKEGSVVKIASVVKQVTEFRGEKQISLGNLLSA